MAFMCITTYDYSVYPAVGIETMVSMAKVNIPASNDTSDSGDGIYHAHAVVAAFGIIFTMAHGGTIVWKFATDTIRDNVYENIADLALPVTTMENIIATT
jgi:hypothetical protein